MAVKKPHPGKTIHDVNKSFKEFLEAHNIKAIVKEVEREGKQNQFHVILDNFWVRQPLEDGKPRTKMDDSAFGVGITEENAWFSLAILCEHAEIHNPFTGENYTVPFFGYAVVESE